ncbi:FAD/NAD(P)-binding protein, partial [Escherichia coli]|nr:FAD/NAD(P)-binding protein [Escherichia coli]
YGAYLRDLLDAARARAGERLTVIRGDVCDVVEQGDGACLCLDNGSRIGADAAVLAVGNLPPHDPPGLDADALSPGLYRNDPWAADMADGLANDDVVLVIGTGLTMIDVALTLDARGFRGRIIA